MFNFKFHKFSSGRPTDFNPHRAWKISLIVFLVATFATLLAGYFIFQKVNTVEEISQARLREKNSQTILLNEDKLKEFEAWFDSRPNLRSEISILEPAEGVESADVPPVGIEPTATP